MKFPKKFLLPALCILSFSACSTTQPVRPAQRVLLNPASKGYRLAHQVSTPQIVIHEYVKPGDTIQDWDDLVTIMFAKTNKPTHLIAHNFKTLMKLQCPDAYVRLKKISDTEYTVEHAHNGCAGWAGHKGFRKIMTGKDGNHVISFDMKNKHFIPSEYRKWKRIIRKTKLSP